VRRLALVLVAAACLVAAGCGSGSSSSSGGSNGMTSTESSSESGGGTTTIAGAEANLHGSRDVSGKDEISIELDDDVDAGRKATVSVRFPKSGLLQFYCKYHKNLGMVGGLRAGS
jgi:hypothetical protein